MKLTTEQKKIWGDRLDDIYQGIAPDMIAYDPECSSYNESEVLGILAEHVGIIDGNWDMERELYGLIADDEARADLLEIIKGWKFML